MFLDKTLTGRGRMGNVDSSTTIVEQIFFFKCVLFINNCIFKCHIKIRILLGTIAAILDNLATVSADISQLAAAIGGVGVPGAQLMREQGVIYRNGNIRT